MLGIWQTLINTPWWVYIVFAELMFIGISATKDKNKTITSFLILPAILFTLSWWYILANASDINFSIINLIFGMSFSLLGFCYGWVRFYNRKITYNSSSKVYKIPGSWDTLLLLLLIFSIKYYIGYQKATSSEYCSSENISKLIIGVVSITNGVFFGKIIFLLRLPKNKIAL